MPRDGARRALHRERRHVTPLRADVRLHPRRQDDAVLRGCDGEIERLPHIRIDHRRPRAVVDERFVRRDVRGRVGVVGRLVCAVVMGDRQDVVRDAVSERYRVVRLCGRAHVVSVQRVVTEVRHDRAEARERLRSADGRSVTAREDPKRGVAHCGAAAPLRVSGSVPLVHEDASRDPVIRRPGVPHGGGEVEEVARMDRRSR